MFQPNLFYIFLKRGVNNKMGWKGGGGRGGLMGVYGGCTSNMYQDPPGNHDVN